ncbi:MAG TPA: hypothetical protein VJ810_35545 [Blastocatellia bacterium]|nr:hypothetical protein [Blastocatellia bacterium]
MEIVLFAVALLLIIAAGCGITLLAFPQNRQASAIEMLCPSFLLGAGFVSLSSFTLGFLVTGLGLRLTVAAICLALFALGLRARAGRFGWSFAPPDGKSDWALLCFSLSFVGLTACISSLRAMGWDGLFNWEFKARIAFLNGGAIPLSFYSDPTRPWTHPEYPLLLPLTEAWLYGWMGRADQEMAQILFLIFFVAALGLLHASALRFGTRRAHVWVAPALMLMAQQVIFKGQGGITSGYADFPLAVFYLAAITLLLEYYEKGDPDLLLPFGLLAGTLPWVKREGAILWSCLIAMALIRVIQRRDWRRGRRDWRRVWQIVAPGLAVLIGWRIFLMTARPSSGEEFLPVTPSALRDNLWRGPQIAWAVMHELLNWRDWGPLWVAVFAAALLLIANQNRERRIILPAAVFLPIALYAGAYIFTRWDLLIHLTNSFPRLLIHVSLVAMLMVAVAAPIGRARKDKSAHATPDAI